MVFNYAFKKTPQPNNIKDHLPLAKPSYLNVYDPNCYISLLCLQKHQHRSGTSLEVPYWMKPSPVLQTLPFFPPVPGGLGPSFASFLTFGLLITLLDGYLNRL